MASGMVAVHMTPFVTSQREQEMSPCIVFLCWCKSTRAILRAFAEGVPMSGVGGVGGWTEGCRWAASSLAIVCFRRYCVDVWMCLFCLCVRACQYAHLGEGAYMSAATRVFLLALGSRLRQRGWTFLITSILVRTTLVFQRVAPASHDTSEFSLVSHHDEYHEGREYRNCGGGAICFFCFSKQPFSSAMHACGTRQTMVAINFSGQSIAIDTSKKPILDTADDPTPGDGVPAHRHCRPRLHPGPGRYGVTRTRTRAGARTHARILRAHVNVRRKFKAQTRSWGLDIRPPNSGLHISSLFL